MNLEGKNAIVTGAAKRLGRAIALALAEKGMNVAIHFHNSKKEALELVSEIEKLGRTALAVKADVLKRRQICSAMDHIYKSFGEIHLLINNAAIFGSSNLLDINDNDWDRYLNINLKAPFYFTQEMMQRNSGEAAKIVNIADTYGASPAADFIPYGVSKGGVISLTKGLAKALAPKILVNCICPGPIAISRSEKQYQKAVDATLLKREGSIQDIVKTVLFLAGNDYITGQAIFVDGGKHI